MNIYPFLDKYTCKPLCRAVPKTGCLWMRIWNKGWWEVVLLHFTVTEWKESFIMTGHAFIQHFIQNEEPLVPHVIRHCAISSSLHMRSPFCFGVQSDRVITCTLNRIRKGINHPFNSIEISFWSSSVGSIKVFTFSVRLSRQSDYKLIIWLHVNVATEISFLSVSHTPSEYSVYHSALVSTVYSRRAHCTVCFYLASVWLALHCD